jgi:integrase
MGSADTVPGFLARIDRSGQCWRWPGAWQAGGYPLVRFQGRQWLVHRLAYNLLIGPLDQGEQLVKACAQQGCVRPGPGHWELRRSPHDQMLGELPRGIRYQGADKHGVDVWRVSVYLGRDRQRRRVEQRVRVRGALDDAIAKRDELLARRQAERRKVTAGVYGKTMAELLDRYFAIWQKTPRKGHLPAKITVYHRSLLIEQVLKPAFGHRIPGQIQPGEIADWYDELIEDGYITQKTIHDLVVVGSCRRCGAQVEALAEGRRRTASATCPTPGCATSVLCRWQGQRRARVVVKQHPPASGSTLGDLHAILRGAFRFGVQRGWLAMGENPMTFVERRTDQHVMQRPPSPEQVRGALVAAVDHPEPNLRPLLACLADTGARLGEALALRESDLDPIRCAVRIDKAVSEPPSEFGGLHVKDTKTHNRRTIAIHQETMRILLGHIERCRALAVEAGQQVPADPRVFPAFLGRRRVITLDRPYSPTKMSHVVSNFFAALGMPFTAKSLRAFVVTNWRKARVPDDILRGRVGHDDATPVTDRHYHYRDEVADRQETDQLVGPLLYAAPDRDPDPSPDGAEVISLHAARAARRSG